jgi:hypothetical protein
MTDLERAQALWKMQERRCGYQLRVWAYEDEHGVVHLLDRSRWRDRYSLRCVPGESLPASTRIPYNLKMPTCLRCVGMMSPKDIEPP